MIARLIAREMSNTLGQQVVVENLGGGSGTIAMQNVARAAPDGHTVVLGHVGVLVVNPSMFAKLPYDSDRDFAPVTHLVNVPMIFVVNSQSERIHRSGEVQIRRTQLWVRGQRQCRTPGL
jgi:tripartite-type tricarboxylate transporter receptor subunit TctC